MMNLTDTPPDNPCGAGPCSTTRPCGACQADALIALRDKAHATIGRLITLGRRRTPAERRALADAYSSRDAMERALFELLGA